jgi:hypothetical protein
MRNAPDREDAQESTTAAAIAKASDTEVWSATAPLTEEAKARDPRNAMVHIAINASPEVVGHLRIDLSGESGHGAAEATSGFTSRSATLPLSPNRGQTGLAKDSQTSRHAIKIPRGAAKRPG